MSYIQNKSTMTYYVNLKTYGKDSFGYTDFTPPLSDSLTQISYDMPNYNSIYDPVRICSSNVHNYISYSTLQSAYRKPNCQNCSVNDCK